MAVSAQWSEQYLAICDAIENALPGCQAYYSAFLHDAEGNPVNNLNEVAIEGTCRIVQNGSEFFGNGRGYKSDVLKNPTWMDLVIEAHYMMIGTGDSHHRYLENVKATGEVENSGTNYEIAHYGLRMGS